METTRLSSKGQVIIPKAVRSAHQWGVGLELEVIDTSDGVLLRPKTLFEESSLEQVAGALKYVGKTKSQDEINTAMKKAARRAWNDRG